MNSMIDLRYCRGVAKTSSILNGTPWVTDFALENGMVGPLNQVHKYIQGSVYIPDDKNQVNKKCKEIDDLVEKAVNNVNEIVESKEFVKIFGIVRELCKGVEDVISDNHDPYYNETMETVYAFVALQLYECEHGSVEKMMSQNPEMVERGKKHLIEIIQKYAESVKAFVERFRRIQYKKVHSRDTSSHGMDAKPSRVSGSTSKTAALYPCSNYLVNARHMC